MELKLKEKQKIKVIYCGNEYYLCKQTLGQSIELEKKLSLANTSGGSVNECLLDFLVGAGLPKEIALDMDSECTDELLKALAPKKKS